MRARDVRAIAFCIVTTLILLAGSGLLLHNYLVSFGLTIAYDAWLLTRPRMIRVFRRLSGEPDWSGYYDDSASRMQLTPSSGTAPSTPRPVERR